jgi:arylsulfatase A-like enzyme
MQAHGVVNTPQGLEAPDLPMLAERFQSAGYATAAIVSARHLNQGPSGFGRGFETYLDVEGTQRSARESVTLAREWIGAHAQQPFFV